jgi:hypothetical protein
MTTTLSTTDWVLSPAEVEEVSAKIAGWRKDPVLFVKQVIGETPVPHQEQMLRAVAGHNRGKFGVTVRSGKGVGKSVGAAYAILWFLVCHRNSLVVATAPKREQVFNVLWTQLEKQIRNSPFLSRVLEWRPTSIRVKGEAVEWQAIAQTARDIENIQGQHRQDMLVVVEEASGVEDDILEALLRGMSEAHNLALLVSNPTRLSGMFYDSHHASRDLWECLHFSARDSPLVAAEHLKRLEAKYGEKSPFIAMDVDGEFPTQSDTSMFRLDWLLDARNRDTFNEGEERLEAGVDVARYGGDHTVCVVRKGRNVVSINRWLGCDLVETTNRVSDICQMYEVESVKIDEIGIGAGVVDNLMAMSDSGMLNAEVVGVNVSESAEIDQYPKLRDQLWFEFAGRFGAGEIAFTEDVTAENIEHLTAELLPTEYAFTPNGLRRVDSKDVLRRKIGASPDMADAMMLAFYETSAGLIGYC